MTQKRNNIKLLTQKELEQLNEKYFFELEGDMILVCLHHYDRVTAHPVNKSFHINCKDVRKVCFSLDAIDVWKQMIKKTKKYSLFDVQQAVNKLHLMYLDTTYTNVERMLENGITEVKTLRKTRKETT